MPIPLGVLAVAGAGGGGALSTDFDLLETTVLTTTTASVTFSNLDNYSAYKHLQIRAVARGTRTGTGLNSFYVRFNSDTGTNYAYHRLEGNGSAVASAASTSADRIQLQDLLPQLTSTANAFGAFVLDVLDFSSSSKNTTTRCLHGGHVTDEKAVHLTSGVWLNTNAVTSITLLEQSGNLDTGSRFSLYGIKG